MRFHFPFVFASTIILVVLVFTTASFMLRGPTLAEAQSVETPVPFLDSVYFGQENVMMIFDHELPSFYNDDNDDVRHYDGVKYDAVTITPVPDGTPTPQGWATPAPYIPVAGYGYDQHIGIDYSLDYEPVLAAAEGSVSFAGWSNSSNHQQGYGLHVQMVATANQDYKMWYGHLSTLNVETGDAITASYDDRRRILGISGNTGSLLGCIGLSVYEDPDCSAHLHFEVRLGNKPVNPYGWIGMESDPWSIRPDGAASYNLWLDPPAINTAQYPSGAPVAAPPQNDYLIEIDDSDPTSFTHGDCWTDTGEFHQVVIPWPPTAAELCPARWSLDQAITAPSGDYDVYVRIPPEATSLIGGYKIIHDGEVNEARVVQGAYPNEAHGEWAYIGRYDFALNGVSSEFIQLNYLSFFDADSQDTVMVADAIRLHPAERVPDLEISIGRGRDDAGGPNLTDAGACTSESNGENEIYFGHCEDGTPTISGLRFDDVALPKDADITAARLEFIVDGAFDDPLSLQINGEAGKDPSTFNPDSLPSTRTLLNTPAVPWMLGGENVWHEGRADVSPDITPLVQAIIDQPSWEEGDAMVFIIRPTGSGTAARRVFAWERYGSPTQAAKLQIWLAAPAPPPPPVGLRAAYNDGSIGPTGYGKIDEIIRNPPGHVRLAWSGSDYPTGTTFNVYRSQVGTPVISNGERIATGISLSSYWDDYGQDGDWYVVTAVDADGESDPSAPVEARPTCRRC